jgi:3-phenylpropionate/trans-cinnamate dioxygenase ferredoxin reductase component
MKRVVIIGNGVAGTNVARYIRKKSNYEITMISEETLQPFSRTALMYIYMGHLKEQNTWLYEDWFWAKNRIQRIQARVNRIDTTLKSLHLNDGKVVQYDALVIATGSKPNKFGWTGQDLDGAQGLYHLQDLHNMERNTPGLKHAVIVGGGLIGVEMAEMFHSRHIPVTMLVREDSFWNGVLPAEESAMVNRHIREHGIDLRLSTELRSIEDDGTGRVGAIVTNTGERIECQFTGLTVGVSPNIGFLEGSGIETDRGILADPYLRTSAPDVYAVGDCVQLRQPNAGRKPIEAVWYTGRMMGQTVAHTICDDAKPYDPGIWFNSAKFFDIEYQVYGDIPARLPEGIKTIYWEHPDGKKAIRINYDSQTQAVKGFNLMGIRYRHEVCEHWIAQQTPIQTVLKDLSKANFDPELFQRYEKHLKLA